MFRLWIFTGIAAQDGQDFFCFQEKGQLMSDIFNKDFQDFISCLNRFGVEYILVGGYSVILHGYSRTTGDLDIWVNQTENNYKKLVQSFNCFQLPTFDMTMKNFMHNSKFDVFTFGRPPVAIYIMTAVKGLKFEDCFKKAIVQEINGIQIRFIHLNDLIQAKKASNRSKDWNDIEHLRK